MCPIIRKMVGLPPPPPPMTPEPATRAVNTKRAASVVATGSQVHVSGCHNYFSSWQPLEQTLPLSLASASALVHATHRGTMIMPWTNSELKEVLYCKQISGTLISLGQLINHGYNPMFQGNDILVLDKEGRIFLFAKFCNDTWVVSDPLKICTNEFITPASKPLIYAITKNKSYDWHCCLDHASDWVVRKFLQLYVPLFNQKQWTPFVCEHCLVSKSTRRALQAQDEIPRALPRDLMVTDVMGPIPQVDIHGNKYLLMLRDHALTFVFCFPMKSQDQVTSVLTNMLKLIKNVFQKSVKFIRSDNAKEYK
ncbi:hypothetical protein O181_070668 [Austropuccinia psidii MF-1]|uniref:Integrase catalytic domain-containing protein n=1 Tax=Austropuccinia psidii MF-1 TaxID=1389203 RepID=A0A9Q3F4B5_9BASI|nr:hypothetical protein [Austropuccinia psidii MF-1]